MFSNDSIVLQLHQRLEHTGARCKVLRCVEWGGPNRGPKRYRPPGTPYDQVVNQRVQGNATLTAGEVYKAHSGARNQCELCHWRLHERFDWPASWLAGSDSMMTYTALYMVAACLCAG